LTPSLAVATAGCYPEVELCCICLALANLAIAPVHKKLPSASFRGRPGGLAGSALSVMHRLRPRASFDYDAPASVASEHVNIAVGHAPTMPNRWRQ
jgi:hypothetical protein